MLVKGTHLKQLVANIFQTEMEAFQLKVKGCMQEKYKTVQTLRQEAEARETKFKEIGKKWEKEILLFREISRDSSKKDQVIDILEQRVLENNLANSEREKEMNLLITMIREERATVRLLRQNKAQQDQETADIRSSLEEMIVSFNVECVTTADLDDNDFALTDQIELSESLKMEKLMENNEDKEFKGKDGQDLDTYVNHDAQQFADDETTHTADSISSRINTLLGKLGDRKNDSSDLKSSSMKKESKPQVYIKTEHMLTDNLYDIKEPAPKKLKETENNKLILSKSHLQHVEKQLIITNGNTEATDSDFARLSCSECKKTFITKGGLYLHIQSEHKGIRYNCNMCDFTTKQKNNVGRHKQTQHK